MKCFFKVICLYFAYLPCLTNFIVVSYLCFLYIRIPIGCSQNIGCIANSAYYKKRSALNAFKTENEVADLSLLQ